MNNERDELADLLCEDAAADRARTGGRALLVPVVRSKAEAAADKILTAGYRKPRTITTVEELDALPVGSVVISRGRSWQRYNPHTIAHYEYHDWQCPDGGFIRGSRGLYLILPATVLHIGGDD